MRLWCWPGATFELGQLKVLVAPPERMAALLELPEIATFHTRYLHHGLSEVLFRVSPIRSEHFEAMACATLDELMAAVRSSFHTVLLVEWDTALAAGLAVEERGQRVGRLYDPIPALCADRRGVAPAHAQGGDGAGRRGRACPDDHVAGRGLTLF